MKKITHANWKKTVYYLRRNGLKNTFYAVLERLAGRKEDAYSYTGPSDKELERQRQHSWIGEPLFSILVPTYRTPEGYLREMIDSVLDQTYSKLELILADATEDDSVERIVREYMDREQEKYGCQRIRYQRLLKNGGISENSNEALKLVTGDYVGLLDHDDVLTPDALYRMAEKLEQQMQHKSGALTEESQPPVGGEESEGCKEPFLLYSDEDKCNQDRSQYFEPHYKMDFNLDLLLSNNYICHFMVMKRELIQNLGFRKEFDGAQDFDLVLRAVSTMLPEEERIVHIPHILYHWRCHTGSTAENPRSKTYAYEAGKRAVQEMANRMGWSAQAVHLKHLGFYGLEYRPDLMTVRADVGAIGGKVMSGRKLMPGRRLAYGAYDEQGNILYVGLPEGFTGYLHRGVLIQDAAAVDIRMMKMNTRCHKLFERVTGVHYTEDKTGKFDWKQLPEETDYAAVSLKLGEALRREGYRICWDPHWSRRA